MRQCWRNSTKKYKKEKEERGPKKELIGKSWLAAGNEAARQGFASTIRESIGSKCEKTSTGQE